MTFARFSVRTVFWFVCFLCVCVVLLLLFSAGLKGKVKSETKENCLVEGTQELSAQGE